MAALMLVGTVPIYNIAAVTVLTVTSPDKIGTDSHRNTFIRTIKGIAANPIIIAVAAGIAWSLLRIPQPPIMEKSISYLSEMATPLSLIALGASFRLSDAKGIAKVTAGTAAIKLVVLCAVFLPAAVFLGFRGEKLTAILVMLGSATTGSCFVMSKSFGHAGAITAFAVMLTTMCSAFTLTMWLFILKSLGYL